MNIYNNLPPEIQRKIKYMVLQHPTAKIINDEIERLNCDITFKFKEKAGGATICKIDGREFFCNEYMRRLNDGCSTTSSDDDLFNSIFEVSSTSSDEITFN
jgi:hypothetical protein